MEEIIEKFTYFLDCIWEAQNQADTLKLQLLLKPGAKVKLFTEIDKTCKGQITSDDVVNFCQSIVPISDQNTEIIGRYFKNWQQGINFNQFFDVLKPMKTSLYQVKPSSQSQGSLFMYLIQTIIQNFNRLQLIRKSLGMNYGKIKKYFQQFYGSSETITKEQLKRFMDEKSGYSQQKFQQVSHYIFGDLQIQIPWSIFFNTKKKEGEYQIEPITLTNNINQQKGQTNSNFATERNEENNNIKQVLLQIQQIQKNMKAKKLNNLIKPDIIRSPEQLRQKQSYRQNLIGKVVPLRRCKQDSNYQNIIKQQQISYNQFSKAYRHNHENNSQLQNKPNMSIGYLKKCESEAQLKIKQIQRRAMDKYLNNHQHCINKPVPLFNPYYHQQSSYLSRLQSKQRNYRYQYNSSINRRNKIQNQRDYYWRPVSPRLLRY